MNKLLITGLMIVAFGCGRKNPDAEWTLASPPDGSGSGFTGPINGPVVLPPPVPVNPTLKDYVYRTNWELDAVTRQMALYHYYLYIPRINLAQLPNGKTLDAYLQILLHEDGFYDGVYREYSQKIENGKVVERRKTHTNVFAGRWGEIAGGSLKLTVIGEVKPFDDNGVLKGVMVLPKELTTLGIDGLTSQVLYGKTPYDPRANP